MSTPLPTVARKPQVARNLRLGKLVSDRVGRLRDRPPRPGHHPSELHRFCPVLRFFVEQARAGLGEDNPAEHFAFFQELIRQRSTRFSGTLRLEFEVGDAIHQMVQYHLGAIGVLHGVWQCSVCENRTEPRFMPRILVESHDGQQVYDGAPCAKCNGLNRRQRHSWVYLEPSIKMEEWDLEGRCDGDLRVERGGKTYRCSLEIKSINEAGYTGKRGALPKPEHILQSSTYAWAMESDFVYVIYVNKNQVSQWKEFMIEPDPTAIALAKRKITDSLGGLAAGTPPLHARICPDVREKTARGCPAVEKCFGCKPPRNLWDEPDGL